MEKKKAVQIIWIVLGIQSESNSWDMQVSREFVFVIFLGGTFNFKAGLL